MELLFDSSHIQMDFNLSLPLRYILHNKHLGGMISLRKLADRTVTDVSRRIRKSIAPARNGATIIVGVKSTQPHPRLLVTERDVRDVRQVATNAVQKLGGIGRSINPKRCDRMHCINTRRKTLHIDGRTLREYSTHSGDSSPNIKIYDSIEEFDKNLPPTVTLLHNEFGSKVYIVGTSHMSRESQDDVSLVIRNVQPDTVVLELCEERAWHLHYTEEAVMDVLHSANGGAATLDGPINNIFRKQMLNASAKLADDLGIAPGGEFRRAVKELQNFPGTVMLLGDRPNSVTLQRAFDTLSTSQKVVMWFKSLFSNETTTIEEIKESKQKELLEKEKAQMKDEFPGYYDVLVTERDLWLCNSLTIAAKPKIDASGKPKPVTVVGVVGLGHVAGICENWGNIDESKVRAIACVPPQSLRERIVKYGVIMILIGYPSYKYLEYGFSFM